MQSIDQHARERNIYQLRMGREGLKGKYGRFYECDMGACYNAKYDALYNGNVTGGSIIKIMNSQIDHRAKSLSFQYQQAKQSFNSASALTQAAALENSNSQESLRQQLILIRQAISNKVTLINQAYEHYNQELKALGRARLYSPPVSSFLPMWQMSQFSLEMSSLLKFDSLPKRKARLEGEQQVACNKLKDEVKKVKLKISLTELEINEAQKKSAKKSIKY